MRRRLPDRRHDPAEVTPLWKGDPARNILFNAKYQGEFKALTDVRTVPVTVIGERVLIGFNATDYGVAVAALR
ncbi:MAG TPA: hypothetical protein VGK74_14145 [Symbiobacteriaceae bacterium]